MAMLVSLTAGSLGSMPFARYTPRPLGSAVAVACAVFAATAATAWYAARVGRLTPVPYRQPAVGLFTLAYQLGGAFGPALAALLIA
ncbi:hypothetical protein [Actinomadura kijaniata]|uniref:hypothetical protein n=1 Tax=Actinomadura kijaniata TaxID=46161 RepID=UPI00147203DA|nr:hypothetical protein [Actinomadura kijaniata]